MHQAKQNSTKIKAAGAVGAYTIKLTVYLVCDEEDSIRPSLLPKLASMPLTENITEEV